MRARPIVARSGRERDRGQPAAKVAIVVSPWSLQEVEMEAKRQVIARCRTLGVAIALVLVGTTGRAAEAPAWQIDKGDVVCQ